MLDLLCLMYISGMIRFCGSAKAFVSMFTVVKQLVRSGAGRVGVGTQRLIFDGRRFNLWWRTPRAMRPVSPCQFGYVEVGAESRGSRRLVGFQGDVLCFYYSLLLPAWMWAYFIVASVTAEEMVAHLFRHYGIRGSLGEDEVFVAICVARRCWKTCW